MVQCINHVNDGINHVNDGIINHWKDSVYDGIGKPCKGCI